MIRAAVDIGTNTVRLLVVDGEGRDLERRYVVTGLGRGVDTAGAFRADSVAHTLDVLGEYRETIRRLGAVATRAVATSATRDASDGERFLAAAEGVLGLRPELISGQEEATLSFFGGVSGGLGGPPSLVIDVGGGSTEFVFGDEAPEYATSVDIGSVRLTERTLVDRPVIDDQLATARSHADGEFASLALPGSASTAIGVGGTFTSLATLMLDRSPDTRVHGTRLSGDDVARLVDLLSGLSIAETEQLSALDPARAPVMLGGAVVVERAMVAAGLDAVFVTEHDLLDGIVLSMADA
ncbi:MAG: Ppx/GppA phosphatase family protein [Acidimicrobiia bacterium]|nr:MAG: Ppx/GppA phosphatase family protein [Acidimicrobiia bacterium]